MIPTIQVLLSTYNGEKYVEEQINSILNQKGVSVSLLVRDDGSKDSTMEVLNQIHDSRIHIIKEKNIGSTKSFLKLLEYAEDADYYAFADQDDIWDEDKLLVGIKSIENYDLPAIYSSVTRLVDANMDLLNIPIMNPRTVLGSAITKNYVAGCTAVFNKKLMVLLKKCKDPIVPFHDWWVNLVALSNGGISVYDTEPHMSYRQHSGNVVGAADTKLKVWKRRFEKFLISSYRRDLMAKCILDSYSSNISNENKRILSLVADGRNHPIRMIRSGYFKTDNKMDDLAFNVCALFKKI